MRTSCILFVVGLAGCGGMTSDSDAMRSSIDEAVQEDQLHLAAAREVATLFAMDMEVDRHASAMVVITDDMRAQLSPMQHCAGMGSMMNLRDEMVAEVAAHAIAIYTTTTLDEARAEVEHHTSRMTTMLDDMHVMMDGMHCSGW